jgi:hypothetical protein
MNIGRLAEDNIKRFNEYELVNFEGQWQIGRASCRERVSIDV